MIDEFGIELDEFEKTPSKAIREYCISQCSYSAHNVKLCSSGNSYQGEKPCPLYPFRLGTNPFNKKNLSPEQRMKIAKRLKNVRESNEINHFSP